MPNTDDRLPNRHSDEEAATPPCHDVVVYLEAHPLWRSRRQFEDVLYMSHADGQSSCEELPMMQASSNDQREASSLRASEVLFGVLILSIASASIIAFQFALAASLKTVASLFVAYL